jgi:hypothetical protein
MRTRAPSLLLLAALPLAAEPPEPAPAVYESEMAEYDVGALSAGEWVEYELSGPGWAAPAAAKKAVRRLACVGVEGDVARVEVTLKNAGAPWEGHVLSLDVRRSDRLVSAAFWGRAGGRGEAVKVQPGVPGGGPQGDAPKVTGTGKVAREKVKIAATTWDCEKREVETLLVTSCCEIRTRTTTWVNEKVPFRPWSGQTTVQGIRAEIAWEGERKVAGGLVKKSVSRDNATSTVTLLKSGTDAKAALPR